MARVPIWPNEGFSSAFQFLLFPYLLIGAAFTFPLAPIARHRLALAIQKEEKKRHGDKWRSCIRRKAGSTKASAIFLDSLNPPGCLKRVTFQADKMLRWLSDPPAQELDTWYGQLWSKAKAKVVNGFFPFLKTTSFIFDYVKDLFLFLYVCLLYTSPSPRD